MNLFPDNNCYSILKIRPDATPSEIRSAYIELIKIEHPDVGGNHDKAIQINLAYAILSDPIKRQEHDKIWCLNNPEQSRINLNKTQQTNKDPNFFVLYSLYQRVQNEIINEIDIIDRGRSARISRKIEEFSQRFSNALYFKNQLFIINIALSIAIIGVSFLTNFRIIWIIPIIGWIWYNNKSQGIQLGNLKILFNDPDWQNKVTIVAEYEIDFEIKTQKNFFRKYLEQISSLKLLISRSSIIDDSEEQIARRISASLFLIGYQPVSYERISRIIIFSDGEEKILIRYRHRTGIPSNISYVSHMIDAMEHQNITHGILFCTPGLSQNGNNLAKNNGVTWYSLETMNRWIEEISISKHNGPKGNIFQELDKLQTFLSQITFLLPQHRRNWKRRY